MNIDKAAQSLELKKLLRGLLVYSEEAQPEIWTPIHLAEFWQAVGKKQVDMFYEVKNSMPYVDYGGKYHIALDQKDQVELWRYDKYIDMWIISDKNHSPVSFFRKLKGVVLSPLEYDILSRPEEDAGFGALLLNLQKNI